MVACGYNNDGKAASIQIFIITKSNKQARAEARSEEEVKYHAKSQEQTQESVKLFARKYNKSVPKTPPDEPFQENLEFPDTGGASLFRIKVFNSSI